MRYFILLALLLLPVWMRAQSLVVDLVNGSSVSFTITSILSNQVDNSSVQFKLWDGSVHSWATSEVEKVRFDNSTLGMEAVESSSAVCIAPNPSSGAVCISFNALRPSEDFLLEIRALNGAVVFAARPSVVDQSTGTFIWAGTDAAGALVPAGTYFCQLRQGFSVKTAKFILVR